MLLWTPAPHLIPLGTLPGLAAVLFFSLSLFLLLIFIHHHCPHYQPPPYLYLSLPPFLSLHTHLSLLPYPLIFPYKNHLYHLYMYMQIKYHFSSLNIVLGALVQSQGTTARREC